MMAKIYNENARTRIRRAVEFTERNRTKLPPPNRRRNVSGSTMFAAVALQEIDNKQFGLAAIADAQSFDSAYGAGTGITVYNPGSKFGLGAELLVQRASIVGPSFDSEATKYVVVSAFPRESEGGNGGTGGEVQLPQIDVISRARFYNVVTQQPSLSGRLVMGETEITYWSPLPQSPAAGNAINFTSIDGEYTDVSQDGVVVCNKTGVYAIHSSLVVSPFKITAAPITIDAGIVDVDLNDALLSSGTIFFSEQSVTAVHKISGNYTTTLTAGDRFIVKARLRDGDQAVNYSVGDIVIRLMLVNAKGLERSY